MPTNTTNLLLYKKVPATDGADNFNIETMLNENWDKLDADAGTNKAHRDNKANPHNTTASQVGAYSKTESDNKYETKTGASDKVAAVQTSLDNHKGDTTNPHGVTASQVGAYSKTESDNKYETPAGAQEKADQAEADAIAWAKGYGLGGPAKTATGDANLVKETGFYYINTPTNTPLTANGYLLVEAASTSYVKQSYMAYHTNVLYTRICNNGTWTAWNQLETNAGAQTKADAAKNAAIDWAKGFGLGVDAGNLEDCNSLTNGTGFYNTLPTTLNTPAGTNGTLIHIARDGRPTQLHIDYGTGKTHTRGYTASGWTAWVELETSAGAQAKANAVNSEQTNTIAMNSKTNANLLEDFPVGISFMLSNTDTAGFPSRWGMVTTFRTKLNGSISYGYQFYTAENSIVGDKWFRSYDDVGKKWAPWNKVETTAGALAKLAEHGLGDTSKQLVDVDLNAQIKTGFYYVSGTNVLNRPLTANGYLIVETYRSTYLKQTFTHVSNGDVYVRVNNNGTWGAWKQQETTDGAQAKANAVNSAQVNKLADNAKANADLLASFPDGISTMKSTAVSGFPTQYGMLTTYKSSTFGYQTFAQQNVNDAKVWFRNFDTTNLVWHPWYQQETMEGAQAKANAVIAALVYFTGKGNLQTFSPSVYTKLKLDVSTETSDTAKWDATNNRFTIPKDGVYSIKAAATVDSAYQDTVHKLDVFKNGSMLKTLVTLTPSFTENILLAGEEIVTLKANDYIELFGYHAAISSRTYRGAQLIIEQIK